MSVITSDYVEVAEGVMVRDMLTISKAIDLYLGDLARRRYAQRTLNTYRGHLDKFCDRYPRETDVAEIRTDDCLAFFQRWSHREPGTMASVDAALRGFLRWLYLDGRIKRDPLDKVLPPRRRRAEDLNVLTISSYDVPKLLAAAQDWTERLSIAIPAYLGPRRRATAHLRLRDYDQERKLLRFREKGGKTIWKPAPDELAELLDAAIADGAVREPDDYLIPPLAPQRRKGERDDRIVWKAVRRVAGRIGIHAHVHALRAAFAVFYLEQNRGDTEALQALMGHRSISTTEVYLRKLDRATAMERVRGLSWADNSESSENPQTAAIAFESFAEAEKEGFEPSMEEFTPITP